MIHEMRTGCQWNVLPQEFGDDSSVHRTFQRWIRLGVLDCIWALLVEECEELGGVDWQWQAVDGAMGKARFGGAPLVPTPRIAAKRA
jgi:putative transposase